MKNLKELKFTTLDASQMKQVKGGGILDGFDKDLLADSLDVTADTVRNLQDSKDVRGAIVSVTNGARSLINTIL